MCAWPRRYPACAAYSNPSSNEPSRNRHNVPGSAAVVYSDVTRAVTSPPRPEGSPHRYRPPLHQPSFRIEAAPLAVEVVADLVADDVADRTAMAACPRSPSARHRRNVLASSWTRDVRVEQVILVVDDEPQIRRVVRSALAADARVVEAATGREGIDLAASSHPALIVLDLGLPDMPGLGVCREIRSWSTAPIIVLSARHQDAEKVALLDAGADDYITKPFSTTEFQARVRAQLRRAAVTTQGRTDPLELGDLTIDLVRRTVSRSGKAVHLTPTEWELLRAWERHGLKRTRPVAGGNSGHERHSFLEGDPVGRTPSVENVLHAIRHPEPQTSRAAHRGSVQLHRIGAGIPANSDCAARQEDPAVDHRASLEAVDRDGEVRQPGPAVRAGIIGVGGGRQE